MEHPIRQLKEPEEIISVHILKKAMGNLWDRAQYTLVRNGWHYDVSTDCWLAPGTFIPH